MHCITKQICCHGSHFCFYSTEPFSRVYVDAGPTFVIKGQNVTLPSCHVIGFSPPVVTWMKVLGKLPPGRTLTSGNSLSLTIVQAHKEDAGSYICKAIGHGGSARAVTQLVVTVVPSLLVTLQAVVEKFAGTSVRAIAVAFQVFNINYLLGNFRNLRSGVVFSEERESIAARERSGKARKKNA